MFFDRVTIIGAGLLGGSLGLALKKRNLAGTISGIGHRRASLDAALQIGAIDESRLDLSDEDMRADLIVICTPAAKVLDYLDRLREGLGEQSLVTDVASTKAAIAAHADATWPSPRRFVGAHPMAGSEKWGADHATADLYEGAVTFLESGPTLDTDARENIRTLWEAVGCRTVDVEPVQHDLLLAASSHVPHVVAAALSSNMPDTPKASAAIGPGFRDVTRIAEGRPELWRDICLTNRDGVLAALDGLSGRLEQFRDALAAEDGAALEAFFEEAQAARRRVVEG